MIRGPKHPPMMNGHCICGLPEAGSGQRHPCPGLFGNPIDGSFTSGEPKPPNQGWDIRMTYENAIAVDQEGDLVMTKGTFRRLDDFKTRAESFIADLHDFASENLSNRELALAIERLLEAEFWLKQARGRALYQITSPAEVESVEDEGNILSKEQEDVAREELASPGMFVFKPAAKDEGIKVDLSKHKSVRHAMDEANKTKRKPKKIRKW